MTSILNYTTVICSEEFSSIPVVTRFFFPPEIPLYMSLPTIVSPQTSKPRICLDTDPKAMNPSISSDTYIYLFKALNYRL